MLYLRLPCFYATLMATELRSANYLIAFKSFPYSILTFSSNCYAVKRKTGNYMHRPGKGLLHLVWTAREVCQLPLQRFLLPKFLLPPLQNAEQKPILRMNSMENKKALWSRWYMITRLIIVTGIILYILFQGWWSIDAEPRLAANLQRNSFKAQH